MELYPTRDDTVVITLPTYTANHRDKAIRAIVEDLGTILAIYDYIVDEQVKAAVSYVVNDELFAIDTIIITAEPVGSQRIPQQIIISLVRDLRRELSSFAVQLFIGTRRFV